MTERSFFSEPRMVSYSAMRSRTSVQFLQNLVDREPRQPVQLQLQNGVGLLAAERLLGVDRRRTSRQIDRDLFSAEVCDQVLAGIRAVAAAADDGNHVVEVVERELIAFQDVLAVLRLLQQEGRAPAHHVDAVIDEVLDGLDQPHLLAAGR